MYCVVSHWELFSINEAGVYQFSSSLSPTVISPVNHGLSLTKTSFQLFCSHPEFYAGLYLPFFFFKYGHIMRFYKYNEFIHSYGPYFIGKTLRQCRAQAHFRVETSIEDAHSYLSFCPPPPKILCNQCEGSLTFNPSSQEDFLILEAASSSYPWPLLPVPQQQQSHSPGHTSTLQSSRPPTGSPCL